MDDSSKDEREKVVSCFGAPAASLYIAPISYDSAKNTRLMSNSFLPFGELHAILVSVFIVIGFAENTFLVDYKENRNQASLMSVNVVSLKYG